MTASSKRSSFWKAAFIYGGLSGFLIISLMVAGFTFMGLQSSAGSQTVGFLLMFFIQSLLFFGMKRFRDSEQGGVIKFSEALLLGLAMSVFAGLAYVVIWEIYLVMTDYEFIKIYTDHLTELQKAKGVSGEELTRFLEKMAKMNSDYARPFYRIPITFTEIFPVGFIVTLVSALILHRPKFWARSV